MGKTEKTGGIGKSPAIEKVNKVESKMLKQVGLIETLAFGRDEMSENMKQLIQIVEDYHISFERTEDAGNK